MSFELDTSQYREATSLLFPPELRSDASIALDAFNHPFGRWNSSSAVLDGLRVTHYTPSGIVVRVKAGRIDTAWVPVAVDDGQVLRWADDTMARAKLTGTEAITRVLSCAAPIAHRWVLSEVDLILLPPPDGAPLAPMLMADHPCLAQLRVPVCELRSINGTLANRLLERRALLLNLSTYLHWSHAIRQHSGWAWDRSRDDRSVWVDFVYHSPELIDTKALERAAAEAPVGRWTSDAEYYLRCGNAKDGAATLPKSLGQTLAAADSLKGAPAESLRRAGRWLQAADGVGSHFGSLSFVALVSAVETLARDWRPDLGATARFKQFLTDMLPCYPSMTEAGAELYRLRCELVHDGLVFANDWVDSPDDDDHRESTAWWGLSRLVRLAFVNWIRSRAGRAPLFSSSADGH